jgi:threonine aldolase
MRQAGVLAACGIIALEKMTGRLREDHENARYLGEALAEIPGIVVDRDRIEINMVFWRPEIPGFAPDGFTAFMRGKNIKVGGMVGEKYRFVTHRDVSRAGIDRTVGALRDYIGTLST